MACRCILLDGRLLDFTYEIDFKGYGMDIAEKNHLQEVKNKRAKLLIGLWEYLLETGYLNKNEVNISYPVINEIVEHYCTDYTVLKFRYKITDRIERPKIAGLMVALIMRYRPIYLLTQTCKSTEALYANETLAIIYGLSVCLEDSLKKAVDILNQTWFNNWFNDFQYLLHQRHYTAEALTFIFKTLMIFLKP